MSTTIDDTDRAKQLIELLGSSLVMNNDTGRYDLSTGNKTALGLFLTLKRFYEEIEVKP